MPSLYLHQRIVKLIDDRQHAQPSACGQSVGHEIDVTIADLVADDRANQIKMQVLSMLHEEAMKSFAAGSGHAADFVAAYDRLTFAAPRPTSPR